jgi:hypothetical protein
MAQDPAVELEAFIRWLALSPEQARNYLQNPEAVLAGAGVSEPVRAALLAAGTEAVRQRVRAKADSIYEAPESFKPSSFNRDTSVSGYGRKRPDAQ